MKKYEFYTDGACSGNPGPGGFAVVRLANKDTFSEEKEDRLCIPFYFNQYEENTTNNRMELSAMLYALKCCAIGQSNGCHFIVYSDSAYVINICNDWIWKWAANDWTRAKGKSIENLDLIKKIYEVLLELKEEKYSFEIKKCAGHTGILGNELADALASNNMAKFKKLKEQYNIKDYLEDIDKIAERWYKI